MPSALEGDDLPVEFINNRWYHLVWLTAQREYQTRHNFDITYLKNLLGLGWWQITDPAHPEYQKLSLIKFRTTFSQGSTSSGAQRASTQDDEVSIAADISLRVDRIASNLAEDLELGRDTSVLEPAPRMSPNIPTISLHALADAMDTAATAVPPPAYTVMVLASRTLYLITYVYLYNILLVTFLKCQSQWHVTVSANYIKRDCLFHHSDSSYPT